MGSWRMIFSHPGWVSVCIAMLSLTGGFICWIADRYRKVRLKGQHLIDLESDLNRLVNDHELLFRDNLYALQSSIERCRKTPCSRAEICVLEDLRHTAMLSQEWLGDSILGSPDPRESFRKFITHFNTHKLRSWKKPSRTV